VNELAIEFRDVSFTYWQADKPALKNISLDIPDGQFVVLTGPTGAGKSTFLQMLNGLIPNHMPGKLEGDVRVHGRNTKEHPVWELSQQVGLVFEDPDTQIVSLTVEDDVAFGPSNLGQSSLEIRASTHEALEKTRLLGFENRNPFNLSGGEKQSLAMAGMLAMHPLCLALDEPTSMLDPIGRARIISILKSLAEETNTTILLVEQNPELILDLADRILLFDNGQIIRDGSPQEVFRDVDTLRRVGAKLPPVVEVFSILKDMGRWDESLPFSLSEAASRLGPKLLHNEIPLPAPEIVSAKVPLSEDLAVEVQNVEHDFGDGVMALKGINLKFQRGQTTAIIGQNGSGKSTLAFHLVGILNPTNVDGRLIVDGLDVQKTSMDELIRHVNYVFQNPDDQLFQETVADEIDYGLRNLGIPADERKRRLEWAVERFGLQDYVEDSPKSLSRALRTKVAIAAIVSMQPAVMVVDEPTTGLDRRESLEIMQILENLTGNGTTVIFITHEMDLVAQFARQSVVMHAGKVLAAGTTQMVFSEQDILKQASLSLPDIHRLAQRLGWEDFSSLRSPTDLAARIAERLVRL
jgi:energy-coupling factor transporter ATP-binding protein EcfA2